jgi:hypothetical protein
MNLCSDGHDEVCYESINCPACEMKGERDDLRKALDKAEQEIRDLENQ